MWGNRKGINPLADGTDTGLNKTILHDRNTDAGYLSFLPRIIQIQQCTSSFDIAWRLYLKGLLPEWGSVLAESQSAGRGQLGREWVSPAGNIYGALRLPLPSGKWKYPASLILGYLLVTGLEREGITADLKWPNDILVKGKKVCGILIEERAGAMIAGVGINLISCPFADQLRDQYAISAGILNTSGYNFKPLPLWRRLVEHSRDLYCQILLKETPENLISQIESRMAFIGATVRVAGGTSEPYEAKVIGLSPEGGLKLITDKGVRVIMSGSIYPSFLSGDL